MAKKWRKVAMAATALVMASSMAVGFTACGPTDTAKVTYNTYTTMTPSEWNEMTYQDNSSTDIMSYIGSSFYEYDYEWDESKGGKFKEDGTINAEAIVSGGYSMAYSAATKLEDVTADYAEEYDYIDYNEPTFIGDPSEAPEGVDVYSEEYEGTTYYYYFNTPLSNRAWKITLREDLKWEDGTPIKAEDFVYSMKEQLNPLFMNFRANTYYQSVPIINAKNYLYQGQSGHGWGYDYGVSYEANKDSMTFDWTDLANYYEDYYGYGYSPAKWLVDGFGGFTGVETVEQANEFLKAWEGKSIAECLADTGLMKAFLEEFFVGAPISEWEAEDYEGLLQVFAVDYTFPEMDFEDVGIFTTGDYELVICLDSSVGALLTGEGDLSVWSAYYLSSLPLVKKDLYEKCKVAPTGDSTLWTSTYNTSVATTASWGPYKLTQFQSGKSYTLEKNENWFGYKLDQYKDQYQIEKIYCQQIEQTTTQWLSFFKGELDSIGIDVDHASDYGNSKFAHYASAGGIFAFNLYGNLETLKDNGRNNGILSITDFRKAVSLAIDRTALNSAISTANLAGYGYMGGDYYYDIETGGVYRDTPQAKKALLRAYGFTENPDGTWTNGSTINNATLDEAYAAMNGYDLTQAKQLVESAYAELTANAAYYGYDASKNITIKFGSYADNDSTRRQYAQIQNLFATLFAGTSLDGKVDVVFDASSGDKVIDDFRDSNVADLIYTGWSGGVFDPAGMFDYLLDPDQGSNAPYWDPSEEEMTFTMPGEEGEYSGAGETLTMSVMDWNHCLNGHKGANYNWGKGIIPEEYRLELMAKLEELMLSKYYSIPVTYTYGASLLGGKFSYITDEENYFMGFGGTRYIRVNYTNAEWKDFVKSQKKNLEAYYKQSND